MPVESLNISLHPENFKNKKVIVIIFGTRPEIIKLFVLYRILKKSDEFYPILYNTAQQKISEKHSLHSSPYYPISD